MYSHETVKSDMIVDHASQSLDVAYLLEVWNNLQQARVYRVAAYLHSRPRNECRYPVIELV